MSTWLRPRFIGIGVENYRQGHGRLPAARRETERLHRLLADQVDGTVLGDPTENEVRELLDRVRETDSPQPVILAWSGHGQVFNGDVRLMAADSGSHPGAGLLLSELVLTIAASGTTQLLCIVDVCFAGAGAFTALQTAAQVFYKQRLSAQPWAGMLASARPDETAVDGLFGRRLYRLLERGPADPSQRPFWSGAYITGDAIGNAMQLAMPPSRDNRPVQGVVFTRVGLSADLLRNLRFEETAGVPASPVDGIVAGEDGTLVGRAGAVAVVRSWVESGEPGLRVLTGPPASGKTAILADLVGKTAATYVDARGRTADQVRQQLPDLGGHPVVVVDGLDEAGEHSSAIAEQVLLPLATEACVVVGTRDTGTLIAVLEPVALLDLGDPEQVAEAETDLRTYVQGRLAEVLEPGKVARLTDLVLGGAPTFLLAHRLTEYLRDGAGDDLHTSVRALLAADLASVEPPEHRTPLPPGMTPGALGRHLLATLVWSYGAGFPEQEWIVVAAATAPAGMTVDRDDLLWLLGRLGHLVTQDRTAGVATYRLAHESLAGELDVRGAASGEARGITVAVALLDRYRAILDGGTPADEPVYLWEYAWRHAIDAGDTAIGLLYRLASSKPALRSRVALAEAGRAAVLRSAGQRSAAVSHAEAAVRLYSALPEQSHALATALDSLAVILRDTGRPGPAAEAASSAVKLFRSLRSDDSGSLADLAGALTNLSVCRAEAGPAADAVPAGVEAVGLYRQLADRNGAYRADVAMALTNLGIARRRAGEINAAFEAVREAVRLYRAAHGLEPSLASALGGLSECLRLLDRPADAYAAAKESVQLSRAVADRDAVAQPNLAVALTALAESQLALGLAAAVASAREALMLFWFAAGREPAFRPHWARTLTLFSATLSSALDDQEVGRELATGGTRLSPALGARPRDILATSHAESDLSAMVRATAEKAARQAVELLEALPGRAALADALLRLALCRLAEGDLREAEALALRAVGADDTRAAAWSALATIRRRTGRPRSAVPAAEKAVERLRGLVAAQPAGRAALAAALGNLALARSEAGRISDAVASLEEAVELRRRLARGQVGLRQLAVALDRLTTVHLEGSGRFADAIEVADEAVERHRELGPPETIAPALIRLAWVCLQGDRPGRALTAATEAVDLGREQSVLADALAVAGRAHLELGETAEAAAVLERAVDLGAGDVAAALTAYERIPAGSARAEELWARMTAQDPVRALLSRAAAAETADPRAAGWLAIVAGRPGLDRADIAELHQEARRHRTPDPPAFDRGWGEPVPDWLAVDADLVAEAAGWISVDSPDHLAAHPGLLAAEADVAVREAMLALTPEEAEEMADLRETAAAGGIAAAYRGRRCRELAERFAAASPAGQLALVEAERADLLDPVCRELVEAGDSRAAAILDLAERKAHGPVLAALERPGPEAALMRLLATAGDDLAIGPTAEVLAAVATTGDGRLTADFYRAVGRAVAGLPPDAGDLAGRPGPIGDLLRAGTTVAVRHPAVLTVMLALTGDDVRLTPAIRPEH